MAKCLECGGRMHTEVANGVRCEGCGDFIDMGAAVYGHRNGETDKPTQDGHYWLSLRPNYTLVAYVYVGQCASTDGAWGALDSVPDAARWWGPIPEPEQ